MKFERYDSYKDSEIDWLGEIPNEWGVNKIKQSCSLVRDGTHGSFRRVDQGYPLLSVRNIKNSTIEFLGDDSFISEEDFNLIASSFKIREGDLQLAIIGATMGKVAIVPKMTPFVTQRSLATIRTRKFTLNNKYLFYFFQSQYFHNLIWNSTSFSAQPGIYLAMLQNVFTPLTIMEAQNSIVNYLDIQTSKIDQELSILEQKIEKYKELKQTLIAHTVLRGLNKNVELKSSETEWIGDIPKHWNTDRLKNIFNERVGKNLDVKTGEAVTSNILSVMKDIGVINHRDKGNVGNKMSEDITNYKLVYPNDIVVNKMNVMIGSVGISKEFGALSVIYIILITKKDSHSKYYDYFFKMKAFQRSLRRIATGILEIREAVNMTLFMQEMMTKPPYDEQVAIANYLDAKTSKIDSIVEAIGKKIEVLKEFRKTLINDVVMGKVKVA